MRLLKLYIWLLNRSRGTNLVLTELDGDYYVSGTLRKLTEIRVVTNSQSTLVATLDRMDKTAKIMELMDRE